MTQADRRKADPYRNLGVDILGILGESGKWQNSIRRAVAAIKASTGLDAIGIRLRNGDDFPYFCQEGFSEQFLQKENSLIIRSQDGGLCRDPDGNVSLECTCGLVISGNADPENPLFTPKGSFWTNDATHLLDLPENQDPRIHPRNVCIHQGYASLALVPLRANRRIIGLLQLNGRRKGQFTLEVIELLEAIAAGIGEVLLRRRTEEESVKAQERFRIVADFTYDWEWWVGPDGKYIYVSPSCKRITGYTQQEFFGEADLLEDIILPEDRHIWQEHQKNSLAGHIMGGVQFRIIRKDGAVRWIEHACQPVKDDTGRFLGVRGSNRDISNSKQAEEALREKEAELRESRDFIRDLTNSLPDSVYSVSMPERTIEWGNEAVRQLGYEVEECVGRTTEFLYATKEDYLAYGEKLAQAFAAGKDTFETEVLFRKKSGEVFPAEVRVSLFRVNGRLVRVTGIVKDISERKKKEHELQRYQQRLKALTSQLTIAQENERRSIAADLHDHVGQSLALARMQIASVRKRVTEPGQTAFLDEISDTLHQTLYQTRELIYELSPPQLNEIGLSAAIREWLEEQVEKRQGIQTEWIDNGLELKLEQDLRVILFRCVRELLTNVVKHAQATRVKVHVNKFNDLLEIIVSDNGRGFHAGATEKFLTPQGGFGLFSVRERMADFGGAAEISSEPGQGTQVILRVPVK